MSTFFRAAAIIGPVLAPLHAYLCGTKRLRLPVIRLSSSRMPMPQAQPLTIQLPITAKYLPLEPRQRPDLLVDGRAVVGAVGLQDELAVLEDLNVGPFAAEDRLLDVVAAGQRLQRRSPADTGSRDTTPRGPAGSPCCSTGPSTAARTSGTSACSRCGPNSSRCIHSQG